MPVNPALADAQRQYCATLRVEAERLRHALHETEKALARAEQRLHAYVHDQPQQVRLDGGEAPWRAA